MMIVLPLADQNRVSGPRRGGDVPRPTGRAIHAARFSPVLRAKSAFLFSPSNTREATHVLRGRRTRRRGSALAATTSSILSSGQQEVVDGSSSRTSRAKGPVSPRDREKQHQIQRQHQQLVLDRSTSKGESRALPGSEPERAATTQELHDYRFDHGNAPGKDCDGVIATRQRAFVRKVVEIGVARRGEEILHLMEATTSEGTPPFNLYMYNACITALARCGRWRQALAVLDGMRHPRPAAAAAAAAKNANAFSDCETHLDAAGADTDIQGDAGPAARSAGAARGTVGVRPDVVSFSAAITALGRAGQRGRALELLREMREEGVAPNVVTYNAAAHACVEPVESSSSSSRSNADTSTADEAEGEEGWSTVLNLMDEMRAEGLSPDAYTFSTAITACGRAGRWEHALRLVDEMASGETLAPASGRAHHQHHHDQQRRQQQQQQESIPPSSVAVKGASAPNVVAINAAITACGRAGQWRRALDLLRRMIPPPSVKSSEPEASPGREGQGHGHGHKQEERIRPDFLEVQGGAQGSDPSAGRQVLSWPAPNVVSFNAAMEACAKAGRWREGMTLFSDLREGWGAAVEVRPDVRSYAAVLACLRAGGRWESALELLEEMEGGDLVLPDVGCYGVAMSALGEAGEWERALTLLRRLQRREEETTGTTAVEKMGDQSGVLTRLATATDAAVGPNLVCYNAALAACARARAHAPALSLLEEMEGRGVFDTRSFNCAMHACRSPGQWRKATELLGRMVKGEWARGLSIGGGGRGGEALAERRATLLLPRPDAYSFASAITACGESGRFEMALEILRDMRVSAEIRPTVVVYNAAIAALVRAVNRLDAAPAAGDGAGASTTDSWEHARTLLVEMKDDVGIEPTVETYNAVLAVCQRAGAWEGALEVLEEMKRGDAMRSSSTESAVAAAAAPGVAAGSSYPEEEGVSVRSGTITSAPLRDRSLTTIPDLVSYNTAMGACGKAGRWREALALLEELKARGLDPDAISYNTAAAACARAKEWELALGVVERGRQTGVIGGDRAASSGGNDSDNDSGRRLGPRGARNFGRASIDAADRFHATLEAMARRGQQNS